MAVVKRLVVLMLCAALEALWMTEEAASELGMPSGNIELPAMMTI